LVTGWSNICERAWFSVSRDISSNDDIQNDFDTKFATAFMLLIKCFHWLAYDRVEYMEQVPEMPRFFYPRICSLLLLLFVTCRIPLFLYYAWQDITVKGPSMMYMFAFEFVIMATSTKYKSTILDLFLEQISEMIQTG
jgi:E3 ubiquitin-protein ligase synoviolin